MSHADLTNTEFTTLNPVWKRVFRSSLKYFNSDYAFDDRRLIMCVSIIHNA
jgi:hypothetical protein